jgi:hypothetical protein
VVVLVFATATSRPAARAQPQAIDRAALLSRSQARRHTPFHVHELVHVYLQLGMWRGACAPWGAHCNDDGGDIGWSSIVGAPRAVSPTDCSVTVRVEPGAIPISLAEPDWFFVRPGCFCTVCRALAEHGAASRLVRRVGPPLQGMPLLAGNARLFQSPVLHRSGFRSSRRFRWWGSRLPGMPSRTS